MSQLGVKDFIAQSLANSVSLANTVWSGTPHVFRQRPKREKLGDNVAFVIGRVGYDGSRFTAPRGAMQPTVVQVAGQKRRDYVVDILLFATYSDEQTGGDSFDVLTERVADALEQASVPMTNWPDPVVPGVTSTILAVGERAKVRMVDPITIGPHDSRVRFNAIVTAFVTEILQG